VIVTGNCTEKEKNECLDPRGAVRANYFCRKPWTMADCHNLTSRILKGESCFLIVDDDPFNLQLLTHYLKKEQVDVDSACNGLEALQRVKSGKRYGAILMDCEMPVLDGINATEQIKAYLRQNKREDIPIYGITGHTDSNNEERCRKAGMCRVFTKPINFNSLIDVVLNRKAQD